MEIQIADHRPALTIALSLARKLDEPLLPKWQDDMIGMVVEVTKKFFGSVTDQQVRKGLEATVSMLSLGLFASTEGGIDAEAWLLTLQAEGIQGTSKRAVELVKRCHALPEEDSIGGRRDPNSKEGEDRRRKLLLAAIAPATQSFSGYQYLLNEIVRRESNQRGIQLAEWLLANTTTGRIVKKDIEGIFGYAHPQSDEISSYLIPRLCGISSEHLPSLETAHLEEEGVEQDIRLPAAAYSRARKRYAAIVESVPARLRPALTYNGKDWFERFISVAVKGKKVAVEPEDETDDDE